MIDVEKPPHVEVRYEEEFAFVTLHGDYDLAAEIYLGHVRDALAKQHGFRVTSMNVTRTHTMTREARAAYFEWNKNHKAPGSLALVGASFTVTTISNMLLSAIRVLTGKRVQYAFFATEDAARMWMREESARLRALVASQDGSKT